ncbi:MAG: serine/threonine protein kinase [Acidobacteria bacterium]|jgi:serine/threonine-protein kinase|nr:serine/threonine protein kinase [Acidobacteriota bacterium]
MLDQFIGQTIEEKYRIDSVMREGGGSGKTYRATHLLMEKPVTVKILSPALAVDEKIARDFSAEARTVSHISHPNILNVTDFGSDKNGSVYIVLEGADGETLKEAIGREKKFSFERAAKIASQIAAGLNAAHAYKIVHGNLTSENIFLTKTINNTELVKILDFGAGSLNESDLADNEFNSNKLAYRSPEQNSSVAEADERSDIYSLGVIFYEMLAGEVPFMAENPIDLMMKQAQNPPPPLSAFRGDLIANVEPIIIRALAKNPEMRYQSAQEFASDLSSILNNVDEMETIVVPKVAGTSDNVNNNLWKTAFVVLAGISLLAISLIYATSSKQTNPPTQMQTDLNGQPVQPLNPATGMNELGAANTMTYSPEMLGVSNTSSLQPAMPNGDGFGDGYNPWARGVPPPGAPPYPVAPGGQVYTIDPNNANSIFMQDGTVLVPVPTNTNTNANVKLAATPTGKPTPAPANTAQPQPTPTAETKPTPPAKTPTPAPKPTTQPAKTPPAATEKSAQSGKEQDS